MFFSLVINVDPSKTEYILSPLSSDTLYIVQMEAVTDEGRKRGPTITFTTQKFGKFQHKCSNFK